MSRPGTECAGGGYHHWELAFQFRVLRYKGQKELMTMWPRPEDMVLERKACGLACEKCKARDYKGMR